MLLIWPYQSDIMVSLGDNSIKYVFMNKIVHRGHCSIEYCGDSVQRRLDSQEGINSDTQQPKCQYITRSVLSKSPCRQYQIIMDNSFNNDLTMDLDREGDTSPSGNSPPIMTEDQPPPELPPLTRVGETSRMRSSTPHPNGLQKTGGSPEAALLSRAQQRVTLVDTCKRCQTMYFSKELPAQVALVPKLCPYCRAAPQCPQCSSPAVDYTSSVIHKGPAESCTLPQRRLISVTWCNSKHCSWPMNSAAGPYQYEQLVAKL